MCVPRFCRVNGYTEDNMNKRARNELISVIVGLVMVVIGTTLLLTKATVRSDFFTEWKFWQQILVLIPLVAGIVLLIVKPHFIVSKIVAVAGAIALLVVIFVNATFIIEKNIPAIYWIVSSVLAGAGFVTCIVVLLIMGRKK